MLIENILKEVIAGLSDSFVVEEKTEANGELKVKACYTSWVHAGMIINNEYIVDRLEDGCVYFRSLIGDFSTFPEVVTLPAPKFIYGEFLMTNKELNYWGESDKNPFIWLNTNGLEENSETIDGGQDVNIDLYILSNCNYVDWLTANHYEQIITPMYALKSVLVNALTNHKKIIYEKSKVSSTVKIVNFGEESDKGALKKYFNSDLSGLNLKMETSVKACFCKNCKCN